MPFPDFVGLKLQDATAVENGPEAFTHDGVPTGAGSMPTPDPHKADRDDEHRDDTDIAMNFTPKPISDMDRKLSRIYKGLRSEARRVEPL